MSLLQFVKELIWGLGPEPHKVEPPTPSIAIPSYVPVRTFKVDGVEYQVPDLGKLPCVTEIPTTDFLTEEVCEVNWTFKSEEAVDRYTGKFKNLSDPPLIIDLMIEGLCIKIHKPMTLVPKDQNITIAFPNGQVFGVYYGIYDIYLIRGIEDKFKNYQKFLEFSILMFEQPSFKIGLDNVVYKFKGGGLLDAGSDAPDSYRD